jgi:hypothetical protein
MGRNLLDSRGRYSVKSVAKICGAAENLSPIVMRNTRESKLGAAFHGKFIFVSAMFCAFCNKEILIEEIFLGKHRLFTTTNGISKARVLRRGTVFSLLK